MFCVLLQTNILARNSIYKNIYHTTDATIYERQQPSSAQHSNTSKRYKIYDIPCITHFGSHKFLQPLITFHSTDARSKSWSGCRTVACTYLYSTTITKSVNDCRQPTHVRKISVRAFRFCLFNATTCAIVLNSSPLRRINFFFATFTGGF